MLLWHRKRNVILNIMECFSLERTLLLTPVVDLYRVCYILLRQTFGVFYDHNNFITFVVPIADGHKTNGLPFHDGRCGRA